MLEELRQAYVPIFLNHPEVGAFVTAICWRGALNDAHVLHGLWMGPTGPVRDPATIFGSAWQTLKLFDMTMARATEMLSNAQERVTILLSEEKDRREELARLEARVAELHAKLATPEGAATPPDQA